MKRPAAERTDRSNLRIKLEGIKRRCLNKNDKTYPRYGGVGITVCKRWLNLENFIADMGPTYKNGLTIDRINNNKGYSKANCRWVPKSHQNKNKRNVPLYEHNGLRLNSSDWDRKLGLRRGTVRARIRNYGWPIEKAITENKKQYKGTFLDPKGKWRVNVKRNHKLHYVGMFKTESEALKARKHFLAELFSKGE